MNIWVETSHCTTKDTMKKNPNENWFIRGKQPTGEAEEVTWHVAQPVRISFSMMPIFGLLLVHELPELVSKMILLSFNF